MLIQIVNGLVYGGLLYVLSVGLVLIFGLRRVVNFAHGSLFMLGAYIAYSVAQRTNFFTGLAASVVVLALFGAILDRFVFRPLQNEDPIVTVLVTFGLLLVIEDAVRTIWGRDLLTMPEPAAFSGSIAMGDGTYPIYRLMVIAAALVVAIGLSLWLRYSRVGLYVRASSADPLTTAMQGVDTDRVSALVVAVGAGLAGLSGTIAAPLLALSPSMDGAILIDSFIVIVVGGMGSFSGAFVAAMLIGQLHNFGVVYVPQLASMIPLLLMVSVLLARPGGLVKGGMTKPSTVTGPALPPTRKSWLPVATVVTGVIVALAARLEFSVLTTSLLTQAVIGAILATSIGFLVRQNGLVSFGHAAFYGLAGYALALLMKYHAMPIEAAILVAILAPTALAFLLGFVILRIPGVAFSMLTLAVAQAFYELLLRWRELANGDDGIAVALPSSIFGLRTEILQQPQTMFLICWTALILVILGLWAITRGHFGILTMAIRENEERARYIGYATMVPRSIVYAVSGGIAALAGVLFALYNAFITPDALHWTLSGEALVMAIVGGTSALWGPALGAIVFFFVKNAAGDATEHWSAIMGLILIVMTVALRRGLSGAMLSLWARRLGARRPGARRLA